MKGQRQITLLLILSLVLPLIWIPSTAGSHLWLGDVARPDGAGPLTLNVNLDSEPLMLDPALASDVPSIQAIEQLFVGLVDQDDDTGAAQPELATAWTVSPDSTVYTFTLRSDVFWTDGNPVTAGDVRYGILRTLDPAYENLSYSLYAIKNAEAYHTGVITDPNQVGVTVVNTTTLQVSLEHPAAYALAVLSTWMARPMPEWTIEAYGTPTWTYPANIVTNGAYRLTEWAAGDHILLEKNPTYNAAAEVQIDQVRVTWADQGTAWTMYLNDELHTAVVPAGTPLDPVLQQQAHYMPSSCNYYYGYSITQPPFDDVLVRQAFSAATDREGLVQDVLGGGPHPALTFTPPGVFGYVDGEAEGVGLPYDAAHAQQLLAAAGYPGGQGLPPITLSYNTGAGHQATAEYIQQNWYNTLGVSVTLQSLDWSTYLGQLDNGQFQIWRMGWCMDYPEAINFLGDALASRGRFGGWNNAGYEDLLEQAATEQDPVARQTLYRQAEEILVESDAVVTPLFHSGASVAAKPYLERTYPVGGWADIATWRFTWSAGTIGVGGGEVVSYDGSTTVTLPAGAISETIVITLTPAYGMPPEANLTGIGHTFDLSAVYSSTGEPAQLLPGQTYTLTVHYADAEVPPAREDTLALYTWDGGGWVKDPSSVVDTLANVVATTPDHFSLWAVLGETNRVYLPIVYKDH